jgi:hypothetical protein
MRLSIFVVVLLAACSDSGSDADDDTANDSSPGSTSSGPDPTMTSTSSGDTAPVDTSTTDDVIYDIGAPEGTTYLLALATPLDPGLPLQFLAEIELVDAELVISLQPLSLDQGSMTAPRQPVGDVLVPVVDFMTLAFSAQLDDVTIPGAANPVSGADIVGSITLIGSLAGAGTPCGQAEGMLTAPDEISLVGSTWAATSVAGPESLPDGFASSCPGR